MQDRFNLLKQFHEWAENASKTRFGSGFLGALIACVIFYGVIIDKNNTIKDCKEERKAKQKQLDNLAIVIQDIRMESQQSYENGYKVGHADAQVVMDKMLDNVERIREGISSKQVKERNELKRLESEIRKRKEVLNNE